MSGNHSVGACLCGAVRVTIARPGPLTLCHCRQCRKSAGAPFQAVVPVAQADFVVHDPHGVLTGYRASPRKLRAFCGRCGAPIFSRRDGDASVRVRAGLLEDIGNAGVVGHIHVASAAPWDRIDDDLPRYAALEPGREPPGTR